MNLYKNFAGIKRMINFCVVACVLINLFPLQIKAENTSFCVVSHNVENDTQLLTNVANGSVYNQGSSKTYWDYTDSIYLGDPIEIEFSKELDKSTVNTSTVTLTHVNSNKQISFTPIVDKSIIKIDPACLKSNESYEINVSSGVKSADGEDSEDFSLNFSTGLIAAAPYVEGKSIEVVSLASMGASGSVVDTDGTKTAKSQLTDGLFEGTTISYSAWSATAKQYAIVDLGKEYDIAAVGAFYPNMGCDYHLYCTTVYVGTNELTATDLESSNYDAIIPWTTTRTGDGSIIWNNNISAALSTPKKGQYVALKKTDGGAYLNEIFVFAYKSDFFGDWSVTKDENKVSFYIPFTPANPATNYKMIVTAHDETGKILGGINSFDVNKDSSIGEIDYPEGAVSARGVVVDSKDFTRMKTIPVIYGKDLIKADNGNADTFKDSVTYTEYDDKIEIKGQTVEADDLINISVIKSDEAPEEAFNDITLDDVLYYAFSDGSGYKYDVSLEEEGRYCIQLVRIDNDGNKEFEYFSHVTTDLEKLAQCKKDFTDTDGTNISEISQLWIDEEGLLGNIICREEIDEAGFGKIYSDIMGYIISLDNIQLKDIEEAINTAIIIRKLVNGDSSLVPQLTDNQDVINYISDVYNYSVHAKVDCDYSEDEVLTNIGNNGLITLSFSEAMDNATLKSENIVIKKNGEVIAYTPYSVDERNYKIDIASFADDVKNVLTNSEDYYIIELNNCLTAAGKKFAKQYSFKFKGGVILKAPHIDGKIVKNVALEKPVTISGKGAVQSTAMRLTDGKWSLNETDSDVAKMGSEESALIDLEDYYDICGMHFVGFTRLLDGEYKDGWYSCGVHLEGSVYPSFDEYASIYKANSKDGTVGRSHLNIMASVEMDDLTRYVKIGKDLDFLKNDFWASELELYAYVDDEIGQWSAPENVTVGANHSFSIPVKSTENKTYGLLLSAYDEDGNTLNSKYIEANIPSTVTGNILAPDNTKGISAMLISNINEMRQVADSITVGQSLKSDFDEKSGINFNATDDGVVISVVANDDIRKSDRVNIMVISDNESGKKAETAFSEIDKNNIGDRIIFSSADKVDNGVKYSLDKFPVGKYYIRVTLTNISRQVTNEYYKFSKISDDAKLSFGEAFMSDAPSVILDNLKEIIENKEVLVREQLANPDVVLDESFAVSLIMVRNILYKNGEKISSISDIEKLVNGTIFVSALLNDKATETLMNKCATLLGAAFDSSVDFTKFNNIFREIKKNINSAATLEYAMRWSMLLSKMQNSTNSAFAELIKNNSDFLGTDLSYASNAGVDIERASAYFDKENVTKYYGENAFSAAFKSAVDEEKSKVSSFSSSSLGSSGSGAPKINSSASSSTGNNNLTNNVDKFSNELFDDLDSFGWANEAVDFLFNKNIINGKGNKKFYPSDKITRAEFVKMLVLSAGLNVNEKKAMEFKDVTSDAWYYPYIVIGYSSKLCNGVTNESFCPNDFVTRQDMAVLLCNYYSLMGYTTKEDKIGFSDYDDISDYAKDAVSKMAGEAIVQGYEDGTYRPGDYMNRAEASVVLFRINKKIGE